jgi:hypothetical protein
VDTPEINFTHEVHHYKDGWMKIIRQPVPGLLLQDEVRAVLFLGKPDFDKFVYLSYALLTQGPEKHILPALLLDDWGKEIRGLKLYWWIREHGERFPRAEVFGFTPGGEETQIFLRDLELFARYPVYAFRSKESKLPEAIVVNSVLFLDETISAPLALKQPLDILSPLKDGRVEWRLVPSIPTDLDFFSSAP